MMDMGDTKKAIIIRFNQIIAEYAEIKKVLEEKQKIKSDLLQSLQDCEAAARLFGFDIWKESSNLDSGEPLQPPKLEKSKSVKEFVFEEAKQAYPNPVKASELRKKLEAERNETVHDKTVGMTLYRLSQDRVLRREKHNWFYVPEENRNVNVFS